MPNFYCSAAKRERQRQRAFEVTTSIHNPTTILRVGCTMVVDASSVGGERERLFLRVCSLGMSSCDACLHLASHVSSTCPSLPLNVQLISSDVAAGSAPVVLIGPYSALQVNVLVCLPRSCVCVCVPCVRAGASSVPLCSFSTHFVYFKV